MVQSGENTVEQLIRSKVEEQLANLPSEARGVTKTAKEVAAIIMPGIASIISVAVATSVSAAVKDVADKLMRSLDEAQKYCLMNQYENNRLKQYMRRDNVRIAGLSEEDDESEEILQAKTIVLAADMGVTVEPGDISTAHRVRRPGDRNRTVIVRFCHRKKRNEVMVKKKELKNKGRNIFVNDDLTPLRATLLKIVKEQNRVSNATTRDGRILAWLRDGNRWVEVSIPADLHRVGVAVPVWKRLKLDHILSQ